MEGTDECWVEGPYAKDDRIGSEREVFDVPGESGCLYPQHPATPPGLPEPSMRSKSNLKESKSKPSLKDVKSKPSKKGQNKGGSHLRHSCQREYDWTVKSLSPSLPRARRGNRSYPLPPLKSSMRCLRLTLLSIECPPEPRARRVQHRPHRPGVISPKMTRSPSRSTIPSPNGGPVRCTSGIEKLCKENV